MTFSLLHSVFVTILPCAIPPYAFRLSRIFGTKRVGWIIFSVFTLLAILQLVRLWQPFGVGMSPSLTLDLVNFLIPMLLLIGMVHIELLFKERLSREQDALKLQEKLELQVQERTAQLGEANEGLQREISLRRQGEVELRNSKEQYRFLFEENPQPMWIFDLTSFHFLAFNRATLQHYGYSNIEFRDLTAKQLIPEAELQIFLNDCINALDSASKRLWRHRRKDGSIMEVEVTAQDLTYAGYAARLVLVNDVSSRQQVQKQLLQAHKTEVTAHVLSHLTQHFQPLVVPIESDVKRLIEELRDPSTREIVKRIGANAASAAGLTRDLMAVLGHITLRSTQVDLNNLIENQVTLLSHLLGSQVVFEKHYWSNLPLIDADSAWVEQMLRNVILNAHESMPRGGVITLSTAVVCVDETDKRRHGDSHPGAYVCVSVTDTGCGISPTVQARLFEPFFSTKPSSHSIGLGLAVVQAIAKQHSGWVEVSSQPQAGSRFTLFFPAPAVPA